MKKRKAILLLSGLALLTGCATYPTGPSVMALPGSGRDFNQFQIDDAECRRFAEFQIGGKTATQASHGAMAGSAALGAAVGAVAGAAIGGSSRGAAVGAGTGVLMGTATGSDAAQRSAHASQRAYDNAYIQCMYAKGNKVPVSGAMTQSFGPPPQRQPVSPPPVPAVGSFPPFPSGNAPPPGSVLPPQ